MLFKIITDADNMLEFNADLLWKSDYWCDLCVINPQFLINGPYRYFEYRENNDIIKLISFAEKSLCENIY